MANNDFFAGYVTKKVLCASGPVPIPLKAKDISIMMSYFPIKAERLQPMIHNKLRPLSFMGYCLLGIAGIEYKDMNIGPYNEVIVNVPVRFVGETPPQARGNFLREKIGMHILIISVTTQVALDSGAEIWGYPKFLSDIEFSEADGHKVCFWSASEEEIFSYSIKKSGIKLPYKGGIVDFSIREKEILKNVLYGRLPARISSGRNVSISFGPHPIGQKLAGLIENRRALFSASVENGLGVLDVPNWGVRK